MDANQIKVKVKGKGLELRVKHRRGWVHHIGMAIESLKMTVHGMTCGNCARSVEKKLASTPGVSKASVDLVNQTAIVEYESTAVQPAALAAAVRQIGFEVPA